MDRKVIRFRRIVEKHGEVLDLFADLKDKQSGEYILDRQYIEASLDRGYEGVRRVLYDMHVISGSQGAEGYDQLDRLRSLSEKILQDHQKLTDQKEASSREEGPDWETLALQELFRDLTRVPDHSADDGKGKPDATPAEAVPESLAEWVGRAHLKAARWMIDNLPRVSPAPTLVLLDEEEETFRIQIFLLGGESRAEGPLEQCLARDGPVRTGLHLFFPLRYFLEGFRDPPDGRSAWQLRPANKDKKKDMDQEAQLQLYASEEFLLLRLPSSLPVRLFGCSLSVQQRENLIYLHGEPFPSPREQRSTECFSSETVPFPAHRCTLDGRWMYWALRFSWAQGEERIRMFGQSLARSMRIPGNGATQEDVGKSLQEGMSVFLRETAMPQKEVNS